MLKVNFRVRWATLVLLFYFSYDLIYAFSSRIIGNTTIATILCDGVLMFLLVIAIGEKKSRLKADSVLIILFSVLTFIITLCIHPEYKETMLNNNSFGIFKMVFIVHGGVFSYLYFRLEDDPEQLLKNLKTAVFPVWISFTLKTISGVSFSSISLFSGKKILRTYNQAYGYAFLFVAIIFTYLFLKEKKKIYVVGIIITLLQILNFASRTALLAYGLYIVLYLFCEESVKAATKKKIWGSVTLVAALIVLSSKSLLVWIGKLCAKLGISSKIVESLISGSNELDGGRIWLWNNGITLIKENPFGLGAYSDNYNFGIYVHNIFIQILMTFGWIFGGVIIFLIIKMIVEMLKAPYSLWKSLFLMFFSMTIVRLMLSYSFWYDENFWFMIALYMCYREECKKKRKHMLRDSNILG